ncbi:MAG: flagellar biosynthesis protein FlhA [Deltaproteobacteria bacterium]|nr:flagellar biosynthesis protein FlhA [Deltaproteobacteria bacterium]
MRTMTKAAARPSLFAVWRQGDLRAVMGRYADVALAAVVVLTVAVMIVPLPTLLLDVLVTANIAAAVVLLLVSIYVTEALRIATFPTLLLLTTLFRVAIEVSATRLILLHADAGGVIDAFGRFVVSGNLVVGVVVFLILTMVQFVVVAKGAERVAEVGARFALDALPGKQLAIDAELRAGHIDRDEAQRRRSRLARESQFFGAMDGAMKFVKGDAIAGLLVLAVNIVGGLVIGVFTRHLPFAQAAKTYTILTIGEGLVAQIPALVIATAAGVLVTRVSAEDAGQALGRQIGAQVLAQPRALALAAGLFALLALVPGLPALPFLVLAVAMGLVAQKLLRHDRAASVEQASRGETVAVQMPAPLALRVGADLANELNLKANEALRQALAKVCTQLFENRGVPLASIATETSSALPPREFRVLLHDVPVAEGTCPADSVLALTDAGRLTPQGMAAVPARLPDGRAGAWVANHAAVSLQETSVQFLAPVQLMALHVQAALERHAHELVGVQETQTLLDALAKDQPALVSEAVPKRLSMAGLAELLARLAEERVSLRHLRTILEAIVASGGEDRSLDALAERARQSLRRAITRAHANSEGEVAAFVVDPLVEEAVRDSVLRTSVQSAMPPSLIADVQAGARAAFGKIAHPVVLTNARIRRALWKMLSPEAPGVTVLSYDELLPETPIETLGRISPAA